MCPGQTTNYLITPQIIAYFIFLDLRSRPRGLEISEEDAGFLVSFTILSSALFIKAKCHVDSTLKMSECFGHVIRV